MAHLSTLLKFNQAKVLVFGDLMLDRYWFGHSQRISPEAPVPVVRVDEDITRPGGAANVALNLASIGAQVQLLGVLGRDQAADDLTRQLHQQGVICHFCQWDDGNTISKLRVIAHQQQMIRLDFEPTRGAYDDASLLAAYQQQLAHVNGIVLSDYGKGTLRCSRELIAMARQKNIPVMVDPKGRDYSIYHGATVITPNLHEFEAVVGSCGDDDELIVEKARSLIARHDFAAVLVTRGKQGMSLVFADKQRSPLHFSAQAREVFDVTGAGDTVIALLSAGLAAGAEMEDAVYLANVAAGLVVRKVGASVVTCSELRAELGAYPGIESGILSPQNLLSVLEAAKAKGEKIVMTNGCFDILHVGHIEYLNKARRLGDRLLVAVNTDESVAKLKGPHRPINSLEVRMEMLSALRAVDWVVSFSEDTPARLISEILPDILVKGGDYTVETVVGHDVVFAAGGDVKIIPFREGYSTTRIVDKLREEIV